LNDSLDSVECCFDIVAVFGNNVAGFGNGYGNNVERNFVLSTMSKQIEHAQFLSTLSKGRNFTIKSFDIVAVCGNKVECCFDTVAGVDGALQTSPCNMLIHGKRGRNDGLNYRCSEV